jgi:hypothetical protein
MDTSAQPPAATLATQPALVDWARVFATQQAAQNAYTQPQSEVPGNLVRWYNGAYPDVPMPPNVTTDPNLTYHMPRLPAAWEMRCADIQTPTPMVAINPSEVLPFF